MPTEPFFAGGGVFTMFVIVGGRSVLPGGGNGGGCGVILPLPYVGAAAADSAWNCQFGGLRPLLAIRPQATVIRCGSHACSAIAGPICASASLAASGTGLVRRTNKAKEVKWRRKKGEAHSWELVRGIPT